MLVGTMTIRVGRKITGFIIIIIITMYFVLSLLFVVKRYKEETALLFLHKLLYFVNKLCARERL